MRLLLLSIVVYLVWQGLERLADAKEPRSGSSSVPPPQPPRSTESQKPFTATALVECSQCGIHFAPAVSSTEQPPVCAACQKVRRLA